MLDIVDENGRAIGRAPREVVHARGLWHRTAHVWVIMPTFAGGSLLFQRRSATKDVAPDLLDVSVGGHVAPGEEPIVAAVQELAEELGVDVEPAQLRPLGARQAARRFGTTIDREIQVLFGIADDRPLAGYRAQADEVAALVPVPVCQGMALFAGRVESLELAVARVLPDGAAEIGADRIARDDFVPSVDHYFYRACVMADRWLRGGDHLVI